MRGFRAPVAEERSIGRRVQSALLWSTAGNLGMRIGNMAVGVVLARLLAPAEFGVFAVALTVQGIVLTLADLGMSSDVIRHGHEGRQGTITTLATACATMLALLMCLLARPLAELAGSAGAAYVIQVMSLTLVLSGLSVVPFGVLQREFRQSTQMGIEAINLIFGTALTVVLVLFGFGAMSLAISRVLSQALSTVLQYAATALRPRFGYDWTLAGKLVQFGAPLALSNLVSMLAISAGQTTIAAGAGATMLAYYVLAFNISMWPMSGLGVVVRSVALPAFSRLDDLQRRSAAFVAASSLVWGVGLLTAAGLTALGGVLVPLVYGEKWLPSAAALSGLAFFGAIRILTDLVATYLIAAGETRAVFIGQVLWVVALFPASWIGLRAGGLAGAGWAQVAASAVVLLPYYLYYLNRWGGGARPLLKRLVRPLLSAVPAVIGGVVVADVLVGAGRWVQLVVGTLLIIALYLATSWGWFRRELADLRRSDNTASAPAAEVMTTEDE